MLISPWWLLLLADAVKLMDSSGMQKIYLRDGVTACHEQFSYSWRKASKARFTDDAITTYLEYNPIGCALIRKKKQLEQINAECIFLRSVIGMEAFCKIGHAGYRLTCRIRPISNNVTNGGFLDSFHLSGKQDITANLLITTMQLKRLSGDKMTSRV